MLPVADPCPVDDLVAIATAMEELSPGDRDRRIALAGDKVIDLREILSREQRINRGHDL